LKIQIILFTIGKNIRGPRIDVNKNLIPYSVIGNVDHLFHNKKRLTKSIGDFKSFLSKGMLSLNTSSSSPNKKEMENTFNYVENEKLNEIYNGIKREIEKNKIDRVAKDFLKNVPINVKNELNIQEATLNSKDKSLDFTKNISKYLAKKCKKKEEDLLIHNQDQYRIKKEFDEIVLNKNINSFENRVPKENWMMTLRNTKENNIPGTSYIYYGDVHNPFWLPVREKKNKVIDIIRDPLSKSKTEFPSIIKNKILLESHINDESTNNIFKSSFNTFSLMNSNGDSKSFSPSNSVMSFTNYSSAKDFTVKKK